MPSKHEWIVAIACIALLSFVAVAVKEGDAFVADFKVTCKGVGGTAANDGTRWVCIK